MPTDPKETKTEKFLRWAGTLGEIWSFAKIIVQKVKVIIKKNKSDKDDGAKNVEDSNG